MAGVTLTQAQAQLDAALVDLTAARKSLQYSIGDKQVIRANIDSLQSQVSHWNRVVNELTAVAGGATNAGVRVATWS